MFISVLFVTLCFTERSLALTECWWSGCQHTSELRRWTQIGCYSQDKYHPTESKPCDGGDMYRCCSKSSEAEANGGNEVDKNAGAETGICSFYGDKGDIPSGHPTASGQPFNRYAMNAAHKTLPFGTQIRVKHLRTKETVDVTINDRGPFMAGRIVDLTYGAFGKVEAHEKGLFKCSYVIL